LRDEPFDATTTGQNKGVPVSTLSWKANGHREHEIRPTQSGIAACTPHFTFPAVLATLPKRKVKKLRTLSPRKEPHELFL
jgi:hypothetical protein